MVLVLCIGDINVPHRIGDLPTKFKQLLQPGKIGHILCPGNLCTDAVYDYLRSVCSDVVVTQGDFDEAGRWPDSAVLSIGGLRVGVCHGSQVVPWGDADALGALQRRLGADLLVTGHTGAFKAYRHTDGGFVVNPGSATGACGVASPAAGPPSFVLMDLAGGRATLYVYELGEVDEVKVDKIEVVLREEALG